MSLLVDLTVPDPAEAASYYESLLAVTPDGIGTNGKTLVGDHVRIRLRGGKGAAPADTVLNVTCGMLSRILDIATKAECQIRVDSARQVRLTDRYGQRWTLRCQAS
jgi:hypothetical protein